MTKYVKGRNGKFQGSIGTGKTGVPTAPRVPSLPKVSVPDISNVSAITTAMDNYQRLLHRNDVDYLPTTVVLNDEEFRMAVMVGMARENENVRVGRGDATCYINSRKAGRIQPSMESHIAAACTEYATALLLEKEDHWLESAVWAGEDHGTYRRNADIARHEVKRVMNRNDMSVAVPSRDTGGNKVLWGAYAHHGKDLHVDDFRVVTIFGYMKMSDAWKRAEADLNKADCRCCDPKYPNDRYNNLKLRLDLRHLQAYWAPQWPRVR